MPGCLLVLLVNHVFNEDGDEGRTECATRHDVKDGIWNEKCLHVGVRDVGCSEDEGEHRVTQQAKHAARYKGAHENHAGLANTRPL